MPNQRVRTGLMAVTLGVLLAVLAMPISAQQTVDPRLARVRAELPAQAVEQIEAQLQRAEELGLPTEPLLDKAVEGIAKGIPGGRIAGAVAQLNIQLGQARSLLGNGAPPAPVDVAAVADALRRGVPETAVREIARGAGPDEPVALAVHTVGDLMDHGVPADQALAVLEAWRRRGGDPEQLQELPAAVERLIRRGALPGQAAAAVMGAMQGGGPPGLGGQEPGARGQGGPPNGPPIPPGAGPPSDRGSDKRPDNPGKGKPPGGGNPGGG